MLEIRRRWEIFGARLQDGLHCCTKRSPAARRPSVRSPCALLSARKVLSQRLLNPQWLQPRAGRTPVITLTLALRAETPGSATFGSLSPKAKTWRWLLHAAEKPALRALCLAPCRDVGCWAEDVRPCAVLICSDPKGKHQRDLSRPVLQGILPIVRRLPFSLDGRRRGQSQGGEQSFAEITQCSQPGAAVNRISSKVTSSGSHCNCQRKRQSFFSPLNARLKCTQPQFSYMFLVCEETTQESFPCQEKLCFPPEPGIDPGSLLQS